MRVHTRKPHTEKNIERDSISADLLLQEIRGDRPEYAVYLRGLRVKEDLTQVEMAKKLGITQGNLSAMERGKRPIGKAMAKKIAQLFDVDYRYFL